MTLIKNPHTLLRELFQVAVDAASPHQALAPHLPADTNRRAVVIGAGKAAASMASALEQHWRLGRYGEFVKHFE